VAQSAVNIHMRTNGLTKYIYGFNAT